MKKLKIYLDTTVISYLDQKEKPERMAESHKLWDMIKAAKFDVIISDITITELNDNKDDVKRQKLLDYLAEIDYTLIKSDKKSIEIASRFVDLGILKQKSFDDCQHIANAIIGGADTIVSWNFRHIVNHKTITGVKAVTALEGYKDLLIYSPPSLIEGYEQ
jgi:predicted nucleic acid-binding protein